MKDTNILESQCNSLREEREKKRRENNPPKPNDDAFTNTYWTAMKTKV
jgi:hypothetical protein